MFGANIPFMPDTDKVWQTITDSAKTRFDYPAFEKIFSDTGNNHLPESVLFLTIAGHAGEHSVEEIVADINGEIAFLGIGLSEDFGRFVTDIQVELRREILAARVAIGLFEQGGKPPEVLVSVRRLLGAA
jgi:hypothetical protein